MNDDILQKQVLSSTIELRVSDAVQEFKKRLRGRAVSAPDFGLRGRGFESRWRRVSSRN